MLNRQIVINQIAAICSKDSLVVDSTLIRKVESLASLVSTLPKDPKEINELLGVNFNTGVVGDFDDLIESSEHHKDSIVRHVFNQASLNIIKVQNEEKEVNTALSSQYLNLVEMLKSIDNQVIERRACIGSDHDGVIKEIYENIKSESYGSHISQSLDYRLDGNKLILWYPLELESEIQESVFESSGVYVEYADLISPLIPGVKDFVDVENRIKRKQELEAKFESESSMGF